MARHASRPRHRLVAIAALAILAIVPVPAQAAAVNPESRWSRPDDLLPDLRMARLRDVQIQVGDRTLLRFTSVMLNVGTGALEIRGRRRPHEATMYTWQRIYQADGGFRDARPSFAATPDATLVVVAPLSLGRVSPYALPVLASTFVTARRANET